MSKSSSQIFNEKVNLIYEYNKQSPLFVRVAYNEFEKNNFERALEILNDGISHYSSYPVAYIVLGKTQMMLGKYKEALDSFRKGSDLIKSHKVFEYYLQEVESRKKQRIFFENPDKPGYITGDQNEIPAERLNLENEIHSFDSKDQQKDKSSPMTTGSDSIVSETLANIYVAQGEFREALKIFEKLSNRNPQKRDYYLQKINEIKAELE